MVITKTQAQTTMSTVSTNAMLLTALRMMTYTRLNCLKVRFLGFKLGRKTRNGRGEAKRENQMLKLSKKQTRQAQSQ